MFYCDPIKIAEMIRPRMMKDGRYLVSKIAGAGQDPGERKILDEYFRYKEYIDNDEWLSVEAEKRWDPVFLGLADSYENRPVQEARKLEFQNPAYSAAYNLKGDPKDYNKVFTVQAAGCDFDCNYCFVPKKLNAADPSLGKYFSAKDIVKHFLLARSRSKDPMNVLRLSGGNPTIVPEMILDVYRAMKDMKADAYLWVDSNLSTYRYMEALGKDFKEMLGQKDIGVVGCSKGVCADDFSLISGASPDHYKQQFETMRWFLEQRTDFYIYLPALVYGENVEEKMAWFATELKNIDRVLPLRVEMLSVIDYPGAKINFERAGKLGRAMPKTDQRLVFDVWYNKILPSFYSKKDLEKYCCQCFLY